MGASIVQLGGTIIGGAIGGPIGAAIGGLAGQLIGNELFPAPAVKGPRIDEFRTTGSAVGASIVRGYGHNKIAGELMWVGRIREKKKTKKVGGIGGFGGQKVVSYTYFATFAVGLQEGEVDCLLRIKINGRVWWEDPGAAAADATYLDQRARMLEYGPSSLTDEERAQYNETTLRIATSEARGDNFVFYRGTSGQPVDPTIQSYLGDFAPAYRDTAYVVFTELPVTEYGGALPLIEFETISGAEQPGQETIFWKPLQLLPWLSADDPRHPDGAFDYYYANDPYPTIEDAQQAFIDNFSGGGTFTEDNFDILLGHSVNTPRLWRVYHDDNTDKVQLYLHYTRDRTKKTPLVPPHPFLTFVGDTPEPGPKACGEMQFLGVTPHSGYFWWSGRDNVGTDVGQFGMWRLEPYTVVSDADEYARNNCTNYPPNELGNFPVAYVLHDAFIQVRRALQCPLPLCYDKFTLPENPDYCVDDDGNVYPEVTFSQTTDGTFLQLATIETAVVGLFEEVIQYPLGPVLNLDFEPHVAKNTEAFWTAQYDAEVLAGNIAPGKTYNAAGDGDINTYPRVVETVCAATIAAQDYCQPSDVSVRYIIESECVKRGLTINDIDASLVTDTLRGYALPRNITGRDAIEQLRTYSWLDAAEIDGVLKFVPRGLDAVATLTLDDMGAHEYGGQRPPALQVTRADDMQLPKEVRVGYIDVDAELGPGQQYDRRLVTDAVNTQQIDLAVVMDGDRGKKIATIALYDQWAARKAMELSLGLRWLALAPTDCVLVPDGDNYVRSRIESIDDALPGLRRLTLVRDEQSLYDRAAAGPVPQIADAKSSPAQGPTTLVVLDLPFGAAGSYDDAGYDIAAYGILDSWQSAEIFRSLDGGTTYESVLDSGAAIAGTVEAPFDGLELTVKVYGGELLSTTPTAAAAGTNRFAAGVNGRWVIGTFETATSLGDGRYTLSDISYGLFNTMWAITDESPGAFGEAGDAFVMLETVSHVSEEDSVVGQTILLKAVTAGTPFDNAPTFSFIARGNGRGYVTGFGPPAVPAHSTGATYVVGLDPVGEWAGHAQEIAHDVGDEWIFEIPEDGRQVRNPFGTYVWVADSPGYWTGIVSNILLQQSIQSVQSQVDDVTDSVTDVEVSVAALTAQLAAIDARKIILKGGSWGTGSGEAIETPIETVPVFNQLPGAITAWWLLGTPADGETVGDCVLDVWVVDYAGLPATVANSVTGGSPPSITAAIKNTDSSLSGWLPTLAAGDWIYSQLVSCEGFKRVDLFLEITLD